jgi:hypothetical protein
LYQEAARSPRFLLEAERDAAFVELEGLLGVRRLGTSAASAELMGLALRS